MKCKLFYAVISITIIFCNISYGEIRLPRLVRDSMILQRDTKVKIWGWASPGEKIKIDFLNKKYKIVADAKGNWKINLSPMKPGGPYTMKIDGNNHLLLNNILIGDVWLCSGQSNMEHQMKLHQEKYRTEIANANYPEIRQFAVPQIPNLLTPQNNLPGGYWKAADPKSVLDFSAVAYFFAKALYEKYHVPIGLINASVGGSPIEAWLSEAVCKDFPGIEKSLQTNKDTAYVNSFNREVAAWNEVNQIHSSEDKGLNGQIKWYDPSYIPKEWHTINIPGYWEDQGAKNLHGSVWYRREITVPASMTSVPATLFLGRIVDADEVYINGTPAGRTTYQYPERIYQLPAGLLKTGKNIIVVRVINYSGKGGFVPDKPYFIRANGDTLDIKGYWKYKVGKALNPDRYIKNGITLQYQPTALYNAMITPIVGFTIKGFLWYQGESNSGNAVAYKQLFPAMIDDWRKKWNQGDVPFINVQLPGFMDVNYISGESQWAQLREAQLEALSLPNTGMAVTIDLGEWNDVHPQDKKDVGDRAALAAEKVAYGESNIVYSGPIYQSSKIEGDKILITFSNVGGGLIANDGEELNQFAIAGPDKKFVWAQAKIDGDKVIVWNKEVQDPKYVRYAWADNPRGANLFNKEGLPASPFRTEK
ncbi:MAG TPA: sialate O-acetylesterase [Hanamia sp.]